MYERCMSNAGIPRQHMLRVPACDASEEPRACAQKTLTGARTRVLSHFGRAAKNMTWEAGA